MTETANPRTLVIVGAGGHGKMVIEAAKPRWVDLVICDDAPELIGTAVLGVPVVGGRDWLTRQAPDSCAVVVAVGINLTRARVLDWLAATVRAELVAIVHPAAIVSPSATIAPGAFVGPGAVVGAESKIGRGAIVNTAASVDHDCQIGDCAHIGPGAHLCGDVTIGDRTLIGVGAAIRPGVTIGADCAIGAGAAVVRDLPDGITAIGVPARSLG